MNSNLKRLEEDRAKVYAAISQSEMQCADPLDDGGCSNTEACLFHSLLEWSRPLAVHSTTSGGSESPAPSELAHARSGSEDVRGSNLKTKGT